MNVQRYCIPLGTTAGAFNLPTGATVYTGWSAARTAMNGGGWFGDTLHMVGSFGAADRDQIASSYAAGVALPANVLSGGPKGIMFGTTSYGPGSTADGVTFNLKRAIIDARGCSAPSSRATAAFGAVGERITVLLGPDTRIYCPDYNYTTSAVAASGVQYADEFSDENHGILLNGCGNKIIGEGITISSAGPFQVEGINGFSRAVVASNVNGSTGSPHLLSYVGGFNARGGSFTVTHRIGGYLHTGINVPQGGECVLDNVGFGGPSWGATIGLHQAGWHGGDWDLSGRWHGRARVTRLVVLHTEIVQDSGQAIGTGILVSRLRMQSKGGSYQYLANAGSGNAFSQTGGTATGNAIKLGLTGYDNATAGAPSSWLAADGTNGSSAYAVPELCNIAHANEILSCDGIGITPNGSGGFAYLYNRVTDAGLSCMGSNQGNHMWVSNNASHYDMRIYASALSGSANARNAFGSGRILVSGTDNYTEANDINGAAAVDFSEWDWNTGWPVGHWLRGGGTRDFLRILKTQYGDIDALMERIGKEPHIGPV
jgi:hypothetical protein